MLLSKALFAFFYFESRLTIYKSLTHFRLNDKHIYNTTCLIYILVSLLLFFFRRCNLSIENANVDKKEEKTEKIEKIITKIAKMIKRNRLLNSRRRKVCILINTALFVYFNKKTLIIITNM